MAQKTILFVDDETSILNSLRRLMRSEPYRVLIALGAEKALALLESESVDLIISDQRMPGMSGSEFLQHVKERWPHTVRIILSGYAEVTAIMDAVSHGDVRKILAKPWNEDELKSVIRQYLEQCSPQDSTEQRKPNNKADSLEARLDQYEHRIRFAQELFNWLPIPIIGIDKSGALMLVNDALLERIPKLKNVEPGTSLREILPELDLDALTACSERHDDCVLTVAGNNKPIRLTAEPLSNMPNTAGWILFAEIV